jgi:NADH:ubiquinone oxidoreductase subunit K
MSEIVVKQDSDPITADKKPADKNSVWIIVGVVLVILAVTAGIVVLAGQSSEVTTKVRDIFIILLALEMFAIGTALIILIVQVATLTNLLQNEVKPILHSTTDTVNTLKGTVKFLSNNVSEPVIKLNQSLASLNRVLELLKLRK